MIKHSLRSAGILAILAVVLVFTVGYISPKLLPIAIFINLLVWLALSIWILVRLILHWHPYLAIDNFRSALARIPAEQSVPLELTETVNAVRFGATSNFDFYYRLRPILINIAIHRLARHSLDLEQQPELAQQALGVIAWDLIRPDRPPPTERQRHGVALRDIAATIAVLEEL
ncbi:MAG: hypothetical protein M1298_01205 [Chloroflexi bacterium]|nr:hypothetical protein [Chloroflexota bacterium]